MEIENIDQGPIDLAQLEELSLVAGDMIKKIRARMLLTSPSKTTPVFKAEEVATLCGMTKGQFQHRLGTRKDLPTGMLSETGRKRFFTLAETRSWVIDSRKAFARPDGAEAVTIAIANFKGGTTKTTTAMTLAQGLTLLGHRVLVVDTDPQASLTTFFGYLPDVEIDEEDTVLALVTGQQSSIRPMIRSTYWDGLDLVPSCSQLFNAEMYLPNKQIRTKNFEFWAVLDYGIQDVRDDYDVIIIDTPPDLSYVTINSLMAASAIIMPLPPQTLDYASAGQFWSIFSDLASGIFKQRGYEKTFDFIHILLSRVEPTDVSNLVRGWIVGTYGEKVLPQEIPKTAMAALRSAEFGTVYDATQGDSKDREELKDRTYKRARDAYDSCVISIESSIRKAWNRQIRGMASFTGGVPLTAQINSITTYRD